MSTKSIVMQVRIKSLQGDEYLIQVQNDQTVRQLKATISEKANGLPIERQKLVYKGRTMQDTSLVDDYNLEEDCKVHLILQKEPSSSSTSGVHATASSSATTEANSSSSLASNKQTSSSPSNSTQSNSSQSPMDISATLRNNDQVIRMLGQWGASAGAGGGSGTEDRLMDENSEASDSNNTSNNISISGQQKQQQQHHPQSRFELILRERLAAFFPSGSIDRLMENLYQEIDADVNTSSLDDLERLAKQKLKITNE